MEEIKKAHKAMARKYHPDRPDGDQNKFVAAQEAFEVLSNDEQRAAYDREIFGKSRHESESPGKSEETAEDKFYRNARGVWKREEGEEHVSEKYQAGLHQFDRMERKFYRKIDAAKEYFWDKVNNPAKSIFVLVSCCVALYYIDKAFRMYTAWLCSDYIFEEKKRQVEIPNTPGYEKKMKYIEKMIAKVPEDIAEQYKLYGYRRDWLIEYYSTRTRSYLRGETPNLHDALRYMPFVGLDFLESRIPLNPADDFRSSSAKCRVCEFLRGTIVKVYPAELLEQHSQRATEFLRIFLALKNERLENAHMRELDPDWVDRHTGKKNKDGRQWRKIDEEMTGDGYGEAVKNREQVYGGDSEFDVRGNYGSRRIRLDTTQYN